MPVAFADKAKVMATFPDCFSRDGETSHTEVD